MTTIGAHNLARLAETSFESKGDYQALLFEGQWHRSSELAERARRMAVGLSELGVAPGDRVAVMMANSPEVGIAYNAIWRAGAVLTPVMFLLSVEDLQHVLRDSGATAVITTPEFADKVREASEGVDTVRFLICRDQAEGFTPLTELEQAEPGPIVPRADDDLAALLYTGGTTGRSKGVMLTHESLFYTGRAGHESGHVAGVNRVLIPLPLSHAYGLVVTVVGMHSSEQGLGVLMRWFEPQAFLELIQEHQLQIAATVPTMLQLLLSLPLEEYDLSSLEYVTSGGAPLAAETAEEFTRRVPSASIRQGYGLTETAALISSNPVGRERAGSVGLPIPGTEVRILDDEGNEVPTGEVGEICAQSPGVMQGYWNAPEITREALRGGWLHTGDLGYRDQDGYLYIVDRKKDLIIRGGFNVYPRDIEDAMVEHPAGQTAGVIGRPDPRHGEEVVAFVALHPGAVLTGEELVDWARERIGGYKYPREVMVIDAVPLTPVGKVDRKALRTTLAATPSQLR